MVRSLSRAAHFISVATLFSRGPRTPSCRRRRPSPASRNRTTSGDSSSVNAATPRVVARDGVAVADEIDAARRAVGARTSATTRGIIDWVDRCRSARPARSSRATTNVQLRARHRRCRSRSSQRPRPRGISAPLMLSDDVAGHRSRSSRRCCPASTGRPACRRPRTPKFGSWRGDEIVQIRQAAASPGRALPAVDRPASARGSVPGVGRSPRSACRAAACADARGRTPRRCPSPPATRRCCGPASGCGR